MPFKRNCCKILLALLIFLGGDIFSQGNSACGTEMVLTHSSMKKNASTIFNMVNSLKHDTCINKKFSIVFYVIRDSVTPYNYPSSWGPTAINQGVLDAAVDSLNARFKKICVSFQSCSTVVIHNYIYQNWTKQTTEPQVTGNWYTSNVINIYLAESVISGTLNSGGYTYMPPTGPGNKDIIVIRKDRLIAPDNPKVLYHLMGHFFGLPDTFEEITSPGSPSGELYERTNCYTNGDGFCDTEADPYPNGYTPNSPTPCDYIYGPIDGQGRYFTPPVDNFMSEARLSCRCRFTQEQYNWMATTILTQRLYLH